MGEEALFAAFLSAEAEERWYDVMLFDYDWNSLDQISEYCVSWRRMVELVGAYHVSVNLASKEWVARNSQWQLASYLSIMVSREG
jgi:hypothetical protein